MVRELNLGGMELIIWVFNLGYPKSEQENGQFNLLVTGLINQVHNQIILSDVKEIDNSDNKEEESEYTNQVIYQVTPVQVPLI